MTEITSEKGLRDFLGQWHAILFFHASWSQYAVISKQMIEFVESYAKMGQPDVSFFFGEFEGERVPLGEALIAAGVPATVAFTGNGSVSFFRCGSHVHTMQSVVGEGTWTVWKRIDELLQTQAAYQGAAPNDGPAAPFGNSGVTEGPPSVI